MRRFILDEAGTVTVEMVLWLAFLVPSAMLMGEKVVTPLIENAAYQAELNQESLVIIERAMAACPAEVTQ